MIKEKTAALTPEHVHRAAQMNSPRGNDTWLKINAKRFYFCSYLALLVVVASYFDYSDIHIGFLFLATNYLIATVFLHFEKSGSNRMVFYLIHAVYSLVYIFKAIVIKAVGLNTFYIFLTIKTFITETGYIDSLVLVTFGHVVLVTVFSMIALVHHTPERELTAKPYLSQQWTKLTLIFLTAWIVLTSLIMFRFGVAVMGTESVALPFRLSGIFFYSRLILVPLLLLYFLEKAIVRHDRKLLVITLFLYAILAFSDLLIRASKGPLLYLTLYLTLLYLILRIRSINVDSVLGRKVLFSVALVALMAFPLIDVYRTITVSSGVGSDGSELGTYLSSATASGNGNFFTIALERLFHRLVGFTQMAGLATDAYFQHDFTTVLSYNNLARYYTEHYLGYRIEGHLSSPSLLGISLILAGNFWFLIFAGYLSSMIALWHFSSRFRNFEIPMKCLFGYEIFNTIMAGTIDASLFRISLILFLALILEFAFSNSKPPGKTRRS